MPSNRRTLSTFILNRNHVISYEPSHRIPKIIDENTSYIPTTPLPCTGTIKTRLMHTSLDPACDLISARSQLLHDLEYYAPRAFTNRASRNLNAINHRVDDFCRLNKRLSVAKPKRSTRALMAPKDVGRIRKLRKVASGYPQNRRGRYRTRFEAILCFTKNVTRQDPVVGGEEGLKFMLRGWTFRVSKLGRAESANDDGQGMESVRGAGCMPEKARGLRKSNDKYWGGYVKVGEGILDRTKVFDEEAGLYEWRKLMSFLWGRKGRTAN